MEDFDIVEALHQWSRLKQDLGRKPFLVLFFRKYCSLWGYGNLWEHVSVHYGDLWGYYVVLIPFRVSLLILADTSCTERGIAGYNRIHTAIRPNLDVSKVRDLFAIKHYGSKSVQKFNADDMYERSLRVISEGKGASSSAKRRNLAALLRKIMS